MATNSHDEYFDDTGINALTALIGAVCDDEKARLYEDNKVPYAIVLDVTASGKFYEYGYPDFGGFDFAGTQDEIFLVVSDCTYTQEYPCQVALKYAKTIHSQKPLSPPMFSSPECYLCMDREVLNEDALGDVPIICVSEQKDLFLTREYSDVAEDLAFRSPSSAMSITRNGTVSWNLEKDPLMEKRSISSVYWNHICATVSKTDAELDDFGMRIALGRGNDSVYDDYLFCQRLLSQITFGAIELPDVAYADIAQVTSAEIMILNDAAQWKDHRVHYPLSDEARAVANSLDVDWDAIHDVFGLWRYFMEQYGNSEILFSRSSMSRAEICDKLSRFGESHDLDVHIGAFFDGVPISDIEA